MPKSLPELIDPLQLAGKGRVLQGQIAVARFKRLAQCLQRPDGEVGIKLKFDFDGSNQPYIAGNIHLSLMMLCQRCLKPMTWTTDVKVSLAIVRNEVQADRLPDRFEPLVVLDEPISLVEMVEDEILLAVPAAPLHPLSECPAAEKFQVRPDPGEIKGKDRSAADPGGDSRKTGKKNPFAVLEQLKKDKK